MFKSLLINTVSGILIAIICLLIGFATNGDYRFLFLINMFLFTLGGYFSQKMSDQVNVLVRIILLNGCYWIYYQTQFGITPGIIFFPIMNIVATLIGVFLYLKVRQEKQFIKLIIPLIFVFYSGFALLVMPKVYHIIHTSDIDRPAPIFELINSKGQNISSSDLKGHILILDFWATWCKPCIVEFNELEKVYDKYKDDSNVKLFTINEDNGGNIEKMNKFLKKKSFNLPFYIDIKGAAFNVFEGQGFPTLLIIDKNGYIKYKSIGYNESAGSYADDLISIIEKIKKDSN